MSEEKLIKSKSRVQKHGEVFTPSWMVQKMLDVPGVKEACKDIHATFLEPAAGDGNFLVAILERKLKAVTEQYDQKNWKTKSLFALTSIYGIEFLEDNLEVAQSRMFIYYLDWYEAYLGVRLNPKDDIYKSAHYIIHKNIVRGDTLTQTHPDNGKYIMLNEWQQVKGHPSQVKKIEFPFKELLGEEVKEEEKDTDWEITLFDVSEYEVTSEKEVFEHNESPVVDIKKVYTLG